MTKPYRILNGNCLDQLKTLEDNSVDSVVTDPPYGLSAQPDMMKVLETWMHGEEYRQGKGFMGKEWDSFVPGPAIWKEVYRVLKPGGHILAFSGTRTYDLTVLAIRLAGFEIRDMISWVYGSGMPKSHNIGKAIDKAAGVDREIVGEAKGMGRQNPEWNGTAQGRSENYFKPLYPITAPATPEAAQWEGWGTALKPSVEPVVLARKPLEGTVAENVLRHGTGGLNIDGCRISVSESDDIHAKNPHTQGGFGHGDAQVYGDKGSGTPIYNPTQGRWPANLIHDGSDEVLELFPHTRSVASKERHEEYEGEGSTTFLRGYSDTSNQRDDEGSAARFFYCAKASKKDRDEGLSSGYVLRKDAPDWVRDEIIKILGGLK